QNLLDVLEVPGRVRRRNESPVDLVEHDQPGPEQFAQGAQQRLPDLAELHVGGKDERFESIAVIPAGKANDSMLLDQWQDRKRAAVVAASDDDGRSSGRRVLQVLEEPIRSDEQVAGRDSR